MVGPVPVATKVWAQPTVVLSGMGSLDAFASLILNVKGNFGYKDGSERVVGFNFKEEEFYTNYGDFGTFVNNLDFSWDYELVGSAGIDFTVRLGMMIVVEVNGVQFKIFPAATATAMIDGQISAKPAQDGCHGKIELHGIAGAQVTVGLDLMGTSGRRRMLKGDIIDDHLYTTEENHRRRLEAEEDAGRHQIDFWNIFKTFCRTAAGDSCDRLGETCAKAVEFVKQLTNWDGRIRTIGLSEHKWWEMASDEPLFELPMVCLGDDQQTSHPVSTDRPVTTDRPITTDQPATTDSVLPCQPYCAT